VKREALIRIDGVNKTFKVGDIAIISPKAKHRIQNTTNKNKVFIAVGRIF
jgi:quercetin dioxygenase-like cupin family protein